MRKLLLVAACFLAFAQSAFAINLTFKFDVYSSGPSIYPCNAGLKHGDTGRVCEDRVTGNSCSLGCASGDTSLCTTGTTPESCVCSGGDNNNQGAYRLDFLNVKHANWTDNGEEAGAQTSTKINANESLSAFNTVFNQSSTGFYGKQLTEMSVNLGSELYGAEYFVDVCYRGPQIDYKDVAGINFALKAKVTVNNLTKGNGQEVDYKTVSDLSTKAEVKCYMEDEYEYCQATGHCGGTTSINPAVDLIPNVIGYNYTKNSGNYQTLAGTSQEKTLLTDGAMKSGNDKTPRFCVVRYFFKENATSFRKWKLQAAQACTYTEINEPLAE